MTPAELRVFHLSIGIFIVVLLTFMVITVIILKKADAGTGMPYESPFYHCNDCGHELLDESIENGYLTYCPECNPVSYCLKNGRPSIQKCECDRCTCVGCQESDIGLCPSHAMGIL